VTGRLLILLVATRAISAQSSHVVAPIGPSAIANAIAAAGSGDTLRLASGLYREPTIIVDKPLTIIGRSDAIIDGENARALIHITASGVTVRGLTLRNVGSSFVEDRAAIRATGVHGCVIADNRIDDGFFGIYLSNVTDCRIEHNVLRAHARSEAAGGNGIHLWSSRRIIIANNAISGHRDGIYFEFVHDTDVRGNQSEGNLRYGMHFMYSDDCRYVDNTFSKNGSGVAVMYTKRVTFTGNRFLGNWGAAAYGLLLKEIADVRLTDNHFVRNTTALLSDGATRLHAEHNEFTDNGWAVRLEANTQDAVFTGNNFAGNTFDVATNSRNTTADFSANYWAEYRGYDLDRDGRGDVPFHPVRLFSVLVENNEPALLLLHSAFANLLDAAERAVPSLTPSTVVDTRPSMRWVR
jgi:nitrous oxidase accessory protein